MGPVRGYRSYPHLHALSYNFLQGGDSLLLKTAEKRFKLTTRDYAELASFRHTLRGFLRFSDAVAAHEGLTSQHYQAMLILRGWPDGQPISINDLAQQLHIKHNSAVGLVDRLVHECLVLRNASTVDRRKVELGLSSHGRQVLARLAVMHRDELRRIGPVMKRFFSELTPDPGGGGG
jgi:DNA-binding MarR family transcriptional regulator